MWHLCLYGVLVVSLHLNRQLAWLHFNDNQKSSTIINAECHSGRVSLFFREEQEAHDGLNVKCLSWGLNTWCPACAWLARVGHRVEIWGWSLIWLPVPTFSFLLWPPCEMFCHKPCWLKHYCAHPPHSHPNPTLNAVTGCIFFPYMVRMITKTLSFTSQQKQRPSK